MTWLSSIHKCAVTALVASHFCSVAAFADQAEIETLLESLRMSDAETAPQIENRIYELWSETGSPAMDLLLRRGRQALEDGEHDLAIEHFSALIDHAPEFAEGYNSRATAYFLQGRYGLSVEDIRQTLQRNPNHFGAIAGLALILEQLERPDEALEAWRQMKSIHPFREGTDEAISRLEAQVEGREI